MELFEQINKNDLEFSTLESTKLQIDSNQLVNKEITENLNCSSNSAQPSIDFSMINIDNPQSVEYVLPAIENQAKLKESKSLTRYSHLEFDEINKASILIESESNEIVENEEFNNSNENDMNQSFLMNLDTPNKQNPAQLLDRPFINSAHQQNRRLEFDLENFFLNSNFEIRTNNKSNESNRNIISNESVNLDTMNQNETHFRLFTIEENNRFMDENKF